MAPTDGQQQQQQQQQQQKKKKKRNRNRNRKRNNRRKSDPGKAESDAVTQTGSGSDAEEVTLCQLMNICDRMPNPTEEQPIRLAKVFLASFQLKLAAVTHLVKN